MSPLAAAITSRAIREGALALDAFPRSDLGLDLLLLGLGLDLIALLFDVPLGLGLDLLGLGLDLVALLFDALFQLFGAIPELRADIVQRLTCAADRGVDLGAKLLLCLLTGLLEFSERAFEVLG